MNTAVVMLSKSPAVDCCKTRLTDTLTQKRDKMVLIGSDMPLMTSKFLAEAIDQLDDHDCVVGPATDGGYYLIGLRRFIHQVFHGIEWSTSKVLSETKQILERTGHSYVLLSEHRDIDSWSDLLFYANALNRSDRLPHTLEWIQAHIQKKTS